MQEKGKTQMPKEVIFSKIDLKDYNYILENVLEQKKFSVGTKNLLLSMLYKIENSYQDFSKVKVNVNRKNYFLQKIIKTIRDKCNEIELIKPLSEQSKILEEQKVNFIIDKKKGKIIAYPNERILLEAIVTLNQNEIELTEKYKLYEEGMKKILTKGNKMNVAEILRDFNGWSWDITASQMESKNINLVYQNLTILVGNSFLQNWITGDKEEELEENSMPNNEILRSKYNNSFGLTREEVENIKEIDYMQNMQEKLISLYGEENATRFFNQLKKVVIAIGCNRNVEYKSFIMQTKKEIENKLYKMKDNKTFLNEISNQKKKKRKEIKNIDQLLSDEKLLRQEYEKRNSKLPNKEKIFSVSHLRIMLEKERQSKIEEIEICNKQMEPNEYVKIKKETEEENNFLEEIGIEENKKINEEKLIDSLQLEFLDCFTKKIEDENKQKLKKTIYELRYYKKIPYKSSQISELKISGLQKKLEQIEKRLIDKACSEKVLTTFSQNEEFNYEILSNIFNSKIINLEDIIYILKYHKGILKIEIYDSSMEDEEKQIQITQKVELQVKLNKKLKIFE